MKPKSSWKQQKMFDEAQVDLRDASKSKRVLVMRYYCCREIEDKYDQIFDYESTMACSSFRVPLDDETNEQWQQLLKDIEASGNEYSIEIWDIF